MVWVLLVAVAAWLVVAPVLAVGFGRAFAAGWEAEDEVPARRVARARARGLNRA